MKDFPALMCNPKVWLKTCNCSKRIITEECHQQKQGDICYEMHISGDNGSLAIEMLSSAYVKDIPCRLATNRERGTPNQTPHL